MKDRDRTKRLNEYARTPKAIRQRQRAARRRQHHMNSNRETTTHRPTIDRTPTKTTRAPKQTGFVRRMVNKAFSLFTSRGRQGGGR